MARPRFRFIPTLGVGADADAARVLFEDGLGLPCLDEDETHLAYGRGRLSLYVDTTGASSGLQGFTPMLATDDLEAAVAHLEGLGCVTQPMPWAEDAPGVLVFGPGTIRFCVVALDEVVEMRARRFLDDESMEGAPVSSTEGAPVSGGNSPLPVRFDTDPHRAVTKPGSFLVDPGNSGERDED